MPFARTENLQAL